MGEGPNKSERHAAEGVVQEYSFEEGVAEAVRRITHLLETTDRDLFVGINGSDSDVGKTRLLGTIGRALKRMQVPVAVMNDPNTDALITSKGSMEFSKEYFSKTGDPKPLNGVYLVQNVEIYTHQPSTEEHRQVLREQNGKDLACDLYIGIYRPDKPFDKRIVATADMMIRNDDAVDKSRF